MPCLYHSVWCERAIQCKLRSTAKRSHQWAAESEDSRGSCYDPWPVKSAPGKSVVKMLSASCWAFLELLQRKYRKLSVLLVNNLLILICLPCQNGQSGCYKKPTTTMLSARASDYSINWCVAVFLGSNPRTPGVALSSPLSSWGNSVPIIVQRRNTILFSVRVPVLSEKTYWVCPRSSVILRARHWTRESFSSSYMSKSWVMKKTWPIFTSSMDR